MGLLTVVSHYEINYEKAVKANNPVSSIQKHSGRRVENSTRKIKALIKLKVKYMYC